MPKYRSPGITAIYNDFHADKSTKRVLDLGQMRADNFNFFSDLQCNIHFENLNDFVRENRNKKAEEVIPKLKIFLLSQFNKKKFNLILAWDLFNYFPIDTLKYFLEFVQPHCEDHCLLHLYSYTQKSIPALPASYRILDKHYVDFTPEQNTDRKIPAIATYNLLKNTPGFVMQLSLANKHGMNSGTAEYLLQYAPKSNKLTKKAAIKLELEDQNIDKRLPKHISPSLQTITNSKNKTLLDLGLSNQHNASWFAKRFSIVYTENILTSLKLNKTNPSGNIETDHFRANLFNFEKGTKFDYIFLWDTLNYLNFDQIEELFFKLSAHLTSDTQIFCFIYTQSSAPKSPRIFKMVDSATMTLENSNLNLGSYSPSNSFTLSKALPGIVIHKTLLFKKGMHPGITEYQLSFYSNKHKQVV